MVRLRVYNWRSDIVLYYSLSASLLEQGVEPEVYVAFHSVLSLLKLKHGQGVPEDPS